MDTDLGMLDATAQAELVASGQMSPSELVDAAIERMERVNPSCARIRPVVVVGAARWPEPWCAARLRWRPDPPGSGR